ncbi:MAG: ThuA domain-containing protein [Rhodovibrionaceae bacterium]
MRNLVLTGGIRHDFTDNTAAVIALLDSVGIESEATEDIDAGVAALALGSFDLVTVMALRWPMEGNPKYAPYRAEWAYSMPRETQWNLANYVERGGGLFGLHTAALCFDDWEGWRALLGGQWRWGRSFHPPRGPVRVTATAQSHPLTEDLSGFSLEDEVFSQLSLARDVMPLLTARAETGDSTDQPVLWARQVGAGRAVYDALGHDRASLETPEHARLIQRCALWAGGAEVPS